MSQPTREQILNDPRIVLSDFNREDIELIRSSLVITAKQIMCKFGYMELNEDLIDKYTIDEVFNQMPDETKIMFFAVNNAGVVLEVEKRLREQREQENKLLSAELLGCQIQIIELQNKLK